MTSEEFKNAYDARNFYNYTTNEERCHFGNSPTLRDCVKQFGRKTTADVMLPYLDLFFGFLAASKTPTPSQRQTICWLTIQNYPSLKMSEWLLFFTKAMAGQFGKFYNNVDPLDIMTAVKEWAEFCNDKRATRRAREIEEEQQKAREYAPISEAERAAMLERMQGIINRFKEGTK